MFAATDCGECIAAVVVSGLALCRRRCWMHPGKMYEFIYLLHRPDIEVPHKMMHDV